MNINSVIASPKGIYGFVEFETEDELIQKWEDCSYELSTKVQAKLSEHLDNLRWDIYLILIVNSNISPLSRKVIENDRKFFKKI
ncbi:ABC-three component system middle component 1, partial [Neobacillus vireti]|uniref:ABC-three component system middle component 1 n=1 Tax=Neobacillus vireti TaxID=220686 RepID=UPI003B587CA4